jgi:formyl-CoA transferase
VAGVLEGTLVLDLAQGWAGPAAAMYLADQGAEVIKVEPLAGDIARGWYPSPALQGTSRSYLAINRNKQGIALDLASPDGQEVVAKLASTADVAIVNALPEQAKRLGIDHETLSSANERLVYAAISGYGDRGPYAGQPAFDQIIQGLSGAMDRRTPEGTPLRPGVWVADMSTPMLLAYGISLALLARERTGRGQRVDTSLLQSAIALQSVDLVYLDVDRQLPDISYVASGVYRCSDGRHINVAALTEKQIVAMCTLLGLTQVIEDPAFLAGEIELPTLQRQWRTEMAAAFEARPAKEWVRLLTEAGVPCGDILTRDEVLQEAQVLENEAIVPVEHPDAGATRIVGIPVRLSDNAGGIRAPAPSLGQHTDDVLRRLGYADGEIEGLRAKRVVA